MKYLHIASTLLICFSTVFDGRSQNPAAPSFKLFLVGDAGERDTTGATLNDLKIKLRDNPNSAVIFLGDNCYKKALLGLVNVEVKGYDGSKVTRKRIMSQLTILRGYKGSAYFVPGNHDWWNLTSVKKGKKRLLMEENFIEDSLKNFNSLMNDQKDVFLPSNGSPGPVYREFNSDKIRIIFIDTYRLIIEESRNKNKDTFLLNKFYSDLEDQLRDATTKHQKIIVVAHHPVHSTGKHSQPLAFWEKLMRRFADSNSNYPPYHTMAVRLDSLLKAYHHPDIYYASGHEHSLEYFFNDSLHYIVSGAGSKVDKVSMESHHDDHECVRWNEEGFFEIDFNAGYETVIMYHRKDDHSELKADCLAGCK